MHTQNKKERFSLFNVSHQWLLHEVFIGGVTPLMYNYSFAPLQRSYSRNISGRTRDFQIPPYVRYSSEQARPDRRRPWGSTDHFSSGRLCRPVFTCLRLPTRGPTRRASPCLLLTSASLLLTSCLRAPSATGPKVVSPTLCTARKLLGPSMHNQ